MLQAHGNALTFRKDLLKCWNGLTLGKEALKHA